LTVGQYRALSPGTRKWVDSMRLALARRLARDSGCSPGEALDVVIRLHERGNLNMVMREGRITLEPKLSLLLAAAAGGLS
jgi:hypothetical protein